MSEQVKKRVSTLYIISGITVLLIVIALVVSGVSEFTGGSVTPFITISFLAAFIGGFLSLISPCSAAMLPVFFAYSFKQKSELLKMTFVFYLGLSTIFVPLGFASTYVSTLFIERPGTLFNIAGAIFIILGVMLFLGKSFQFLPKRMRVAPQGKGMGTIYIMGLLFAFASGTCAAPIIGGIFTIAATSGNALQGVLLLLTYALGMVGPLLIMAWFFDRYNFASSKLIQGKSMSLRIAGKKYFIHSTNLIAAILFIGVGLLFIFSKGTNAFLGIFASLGAANLYYDVNVWVKEYTDKVVTWPFIAIGLIIIGFMARSLKRKTMKEAEEKSSSNTCEIPKAVDTSEITPDSEEDEKRNSS